MKNVFKKSRHIRWNWEESPDNPGELVRYHFVVVDDKNREGILEKTIEPVVQWGSLVLLRNISGKVSGSKFRYLFRSYDSNQKPSMIDLTKSGKSIKRDFELRERIRKGYSIEDYVSGLYEK